MVKSESGVAVMEKRNNEKAKLFYDTLDALPIFSGPVAKKDRSKIDAVFVMEDKELEKEFLTLCTQEGMIGVKRTPKCWRLQSFHVQCIKNRKRKGINRLDESFCKQKRITTFNLNFNKQADGDY